MNRQANVESNSYEIIVEGRLSQYWEDWFGGFKLSNQYENISCLTGSVTDQAALFGVLLSIRDLGLTLISVSRVPAITHENLSTS